MGQDVLTIKVVIIGADVVKGHGAEACMLAFDGTCECENFHGKVLPGGVDTQQEWYPNARTLSARYMLEGVDATGAACKIFIENNAVLDADGQAAYTVPKVITDSDALAWLETTALKGTIEPWERGVIIHIFEDGER